MPTTKPSPSWRDVLPVHPAAELFPLMSPDELRELGEDIVSNGLTSPIVLWRAHPKREALLLDGRNRLDGIELVTGKTVEVGAPSIMAGDFLAADKVITLDKSVDPYAYAMSANMHRRHLTAEDKHKAIVGLLKAQPEKSNRQIAKMAEASHPYIAKVRKKLEAAGDVETVTTSTDTLGRKQPSRKPWSKERWVRSRAAALERSRKLAERYLPKPAAATENSAAATDDIGTTSGGELERKDREQLRNDKRMLEIKIGGLESEIAALKTTRQPASASRCEICREKKRATQRSVFVCDRCAEIHELDPSSSSFLGIQVGHVGKS